MAERDEQVEGLIPAHQRYRAAILEVLDQPNFRLEDPNAGSAMRERLGFKSKDWDNVLRHLGRQGILETTKINRTRLGSIAVNPQALIGHAEKPYVDQVVLDRLAERQAEIDNGIPAEPPKPKPKPVAKPKPPVKRRTPVKPQKAPLHPPMLKSKQAPVSTSPAPAQKKETIQQPSKTAMNFNFYCEEVPISFKVKPADFAKLESIQKLMLGVGVLSTWNMASDQRQNYIRRLMNRDVRTDKQLKDKEIKKIMRQAVKKGYIQFDEQKIQFGPNALEIFQSTMFTEHTGWRTSVLG